MNWVIKNAFTLSADYPVYGTITEHCFRDSTPETQRHFSPRQGQHLDWFLTLLSLPACLFVLSHSSVTEQPPRALIRSLLKCFYQVEEKAKTTSQLPWSYLCTWCVKLSLFKKIHLQASKKILKKETLCAQTRSSRNYFLYHKNPTTMP